MKQQTIRRAAALLCAGALALTGAGCSQTVETVVQETIVPVDVSAPARGSLAVKHEFIGRVMPDQSVNVYAKMSGEVLAAPFEVGDTVRVGQLLLRVDGAAVNASVNQAKAAYESAKVSAEQNLGSSYDSKLIQAESSMNAAEYQFDSASRAVKDYLEEVNGGDPIYGYDPTYRDLRARKASALEAFNAAKAAYDLLKNGAYDDAVKATDAGLAQAEASYKAAAQNLSNLTITAPISGVIEAKNFDVHDMASPQAPAYVISNKDVMTVTFNVPASAVPAMAMGDTVEVDNNGTLYTGEIVEVGSIANEQSGLFPVKARIDGDVTGLLSGVSVKVSASAQKAEDVLLVPVSCIVNENGRQYVYVVSPEGRAVKTPVETGITDDTQIEVVSGLTGTERVVTTWSPDLTDDVLLDYTDAAPAPDIPAPDASADSEPATSGADAASSAPDGASSTAQSSTAQSSSASSAQSTAPAASPKTVTSQTAPTQSSQADKTAQSTASQSSPASQGASGATPPANERESLVEKAGEEDPPKSSVPEEVQAGDESRASEVQ